MAVRYCVIVHLETGYATLSVHDRTAWTKRHATKLARAWKADNLRDAFTQEAEGYETCAPSRPNSFRPFPPVSGRYGAPMGRPSDLLAVEDRVTFDPSKLAVAGPAGEYDAGGAYWGYSPSEGPVWAVWVKGKASEGIAYVRAKSRDEAKRAAMAC